MHINLRQKRIVEIVLFYGSTTEKVETFNITVFDLISEHALISGHPFFLKLKKKKSLIFFFLNFFFLRDPLIIISGPSHATIFGSSVLHPG